MASCEVTVNEPDVEEADKYLADMPNLWIEALIQEYLDGKNRLYLCQTYKHMAGEVCHHWPSYKATFVFSQTEVEAHLLTKLKDHQSSNGSSSRSDPRPVKSRGFLKRFFCKKNLATQSQLQQAAIRTGLENRWSAFQAVSMYVGSDVNIKLELVKDITSVYSAESNAHATWNKLTGRRPATLADWSNHSHASSYNSSAHGGSTHGGSRHGGSRHGGSRRGGSRHGDASHGGSTHGAGDAAEPPETSEVVLDTYTPMNITDLWQLCDENNVKLRIRSGPFNTTASRYGTIA